jgi:hypothetical protein
MIHQLRINEIFEDRKDAFHARFRDHDARIMRRYGFHIVAMWEAKMDKRTEFVYLLEWPDERTKANACMGGFYGRSRVAGDQTHYIGPKRCAGRRDRGSTAGADGLLATFAADSYDSLD